MNIVKGLVLIVGLASLSSAVITNVSMGDSSLIPFVTSLDYAFDSDRDTVFNEIFMETGETAGLDGTDKELFKFNIIDNGIIQNWNSSIGVVPDGNPAAGSYSFPAGPADFPVGVYYTRLSDADGDTVIRWQMIPYPTPYRTISGTLTVPAGVSAKNIWIIARSDSGEFSSRANTDSLGNYTILFPDTPSVRTHSFKVGIDRDGIRQGLPFAVSPPETLVNVSAASITGINFTGATFTCLVRTRVIDDLGSPLAGVMAYVQDTMSNHMFGYVPTDVNGIAEIPLLAGTYRTGINGESFIPAYILPDAMSTGLILRDGDTIERTLVFYRTNALIHGIVRKNGVPYTAPLQFWCRSADKGLGTIATSDASGNIRFSVTDLENQYFAGLFTDCRDCDTILTGYKVLGGLEGYAPGDTVIFDIVSSRDITVRVRVRDQAGDSIVGAHVQISTWRGDTHVNDTTGNDGIMGINIPAGGYRIGVVGSTSHPVNYLLYYNTFNAGLTDTETVDVTLLEADTVIWARVTLDGAAPGRPLEIRVHDRAGVHFTGGSTDSSGRVMLPVSSAIDTYEIAVSINTQSADSVLLTRYTIAGGLQRSAGVGDTIVFNFETPSTRVRAAKAPVQLKPALQVAGLVHGVTAVMFVAPRQSAITIVAYDLRGRIAARIVSGAFGPGVHTTVWNTAGLARGTYAVYMRMENVRIVRRVMVR